MQRDLNSFILTELVTVHFKSKKWFAGVFRRI